MGSISTDMSPTPCTLPKVTLWIWPTGAFPRRVIYYFRAKGITATMLQQRNIHLIPIVLDSKTLVALPQYEARPADRTLPALRIEHGNGKEFWIHESNAILEYFEDIFPTSEGYPDMRGDTIEQRARTRDVVSLLADVLTWTMVKIMNTFPAASSWSGLAAEHMSTNAAEHADEKLHSLLSRVEKWVKEDVVTRSSESLSGEGGSVTLADIVLMAQNEYALMAFKTNLLDEHDVLRVWWDRNKRADWFITSEDLMKVEQGEGWESVIGK